MANYDSTYFTAEAAANLATRNNAPNAGVLTQPLEQAVVSVTIDASITTSDFLRLMTIKKPGRTLIPELSRVRVSNASSSIAFVLQRLPITGSAVTLTATSGTLTTAGTAFAAVDGTTAPVELSIGDIIQADVTAETGVACTYTFELTFRVSGQA
jgi:hypothetical protein